MNGETIAKDLRGQLEGFVERRDATARANAIPLPGPLADAFAIAPNIKVGPYTVRPFYDADFEFLQILDHPLHRTIVASQSNGQIDSSTHKRTSVWELFYLMTKDIDHVDSLFQQGDEGLKHLRANARKEFSRLQGPAVMALDAAIAEQLKRYWSPCIGYGEDESAGEEVAIRTQNFPATGAIPAMASAGS